MSDDDYVLVEGHICTGGKFPGSIRPYNALFCSLCRTPLSAKNVFMLKPDIQEHNDAIVFKHVSQSLQNALDNGYEMLEMTPEQVTQDMQDFDALLENFPTDRLLRFVRQAMAAKKSP